MFYVLVYTQILLHILSNDTSFNVLFPTSIYSLNFCDFPLVKVVFSGAGTTYN